MTEPSLGGAVPRSRHFLSSTLKIDSNYYITAYASEGVSSTCTNQSNNYAHPALERKKPTQTLNDGKDNQTLINP
jgi:hypothetical protein